MAGAAFERELAGLEARQDVAAIVRGLTANSSHGGVAEKGCRALRNLAATADNDVAIARLGGIEALLAALARHPDVVAVQERALAALRNLSVNADNKVAIARLGGIEALVAALARHPDEAAVQRRALCALWFLAANNADNAKRIKAASGEAAIQTAMQAPNAAADAKRFGRALLEKLKTVAEEEARKKVEAEARRKAEEEKQRCPKEACKQFLDSLGIDAAFFDAEQDRCYCAGCCAAVRMPDVLQGDRADGHCYEVPKGWCGFGLEIPPRAKALKIFSSDWVHAFHGCPASVVPSILLEGSLLMPGDTLMNGTPLPNRLTGGGEHRIGVYTSPSIKYSELDIYTKPRSWQGREVRVLSLPP